MKVNVALILGTKNSLHGYGSILHAALRQRHLDAVLVAIVHQAAGVLKQHMLYVAVLVGELQAAVAVVVAKKYSCFHVVLFLVCYTNNLKLFANFSNLFADGAYSAAVFCAFGDRCIVKSTRFG